MKKTAFILLTLIICAGMFVSCKKKDDKANDTAAESTVSVTETAKKETENETSPETDLPETKAGTETAAPSGLMSEEEALKKARAYLGDKDPDTGFLYSYSFDSYTPEGSCKVRVSWYIEEGDRYSTCGFLIVTPSGDVSRLDW